MQTSSEKVLIRQLMRNTRGFATTSGEKYFDKILIANRGEIACRVMKTARKLGIKTVAVYSEPDAAAMHVKMADEAYCIGPAASAQSYLNIDRILEVIKKTGSQAVHPGYGFLSENMHFAERLEKEGVEFIGPGRHAIEAMGDKIESKKLARAANVSTVPGDLVVVKSDEDILKVAHHIGYPVMIKASAGGGGKGMRIAWNDKEALEGFRLSTQEARSSFGDDRIFIEKYIETPRHIEIQLIADKHGNVCPLPERECSIQRRNQKVLEESPSSFLNPATREAMQQEAAQLAKAVNYCSAGTVEFLADKNRNFYFLEMNTRLQVEHPVSEFVSGIDLVEQMIRVAAGYPLPDELLKPNRPILGWAHEARVYAEDPFRGFLPSTGRLVVYEEPRPEDIPGIRIDTGVSQGAEISMFYDPMISKLVAHGETRDEALDRLELALQSYVIKGLGHNTNFLSAVCRNKKFREGKISTYFIPEEFPGGFTGVTLTEVENHEFATFAALVHMSYLEGTTQIKGQVAEPVLPSEVIVTIGNNSYCISENQETGHIQVSNINDGKVVYQTDISNFSHEIGRVLARAEFGDVYKVIQVLDRIPQGFRMQYAGAIANVMVHTRAEYELSKYMLPKPEIDFGKWLLSPMPGALVSIAVKEGDEIFPGQELAIVEAMKMQNVLRAEKHGTVKKVYGKAGQTLAVDQEIMEFE